LHDTFGSLYDDGRTTFEHDIHFQVSVFVQSKTFFFLLHFLVIAECY